MGELGKYRVPRELKDEDKWFKFFTKKQLLVAAVVLFIDAWIVVISNRLKMIVVGIVIALFIAIMTAIILVGKMPAKRYIHGGGLGFDALIMRVLKRKCLKKNRCIFTISAFYEETEKEGKRKGPFKK